MLNLRMKSRNVGFILALAAGTLWGIMGLFVRHFSTLGLGALEIGEIRILFALLATGIYLVAFQRNLFRIKLRDLWCFLGSGIMSVLLFCYTNFKAIEFIPVSIATILVYTSPTFVVLMSMLLFHEKITIKTVAALILSFSGCILVCGIGSGAQLSLKGILLGLASGFVWALYSIFSRFAIDRGYSAWTVIFYSFLVSSISGAAFCNWKVIAAVIPEQNNLVFAAGLGVICGFAPYALYSKSLERISSSIASVLSSIEPVIATLLSVCVLHEPFGLTGILGIMLVLSSVVLLSIHAE